VSLLAALLLQAQAAVFAPPATPLHVVTERIQQDESGSHGFRVERVVRFSRDGIGWRAEVRVLSTHADEGAETAAMFHAGYAALMGRTLVMHLDGAGKVVSVDDREAIWAAFCDGIANIVAVHHKETAAARAALAAQIAGPLRAFSPERQLAMLGSLVDVLAAPEAFDAPATRKLRLPAASPLGGQLMLEGTRTTTTAGRYIHTTAQAAGDAPGNGGHVELLTERDADPRTGLVVTGTDTVMTRIGDRESSRISSITVDPLPANAWRD
jgi:hypothetical protein